MMTLNDFVMRVLSVPFSPGGRDWLGLDCWGLVRLAYGEVFGIALPSYAERYDATLSYKETAALIAAGRSDWAEIAVPDFGDVGLYRVGRHETHVTLVLPSRRMIHTEQSTGTLIEPLNTIAWRDRHVGWYRHASR